MPSFDESDSIEEMKLIQAQVGPFRSLNTVQVVSVDNTVTVMVGMNEAGKTVLLKALEKSSDAVGLAKFDPVEDYPRKDLSSYLKKHDGAPADATVLTYRLDSAEVMDLNKKLRTNIPVNFEFSITHRYNNTLAVSCIVDETPVVEALHNTPGLSSDAKAALKNKSTLRTATEALAQVSLTDEDTEFLTALNARIAKTKWASVIQWEVWEWIKPRVPKFLYFSDYDLLPSKMNLVDLAQRESQAAANPPQLTAGHRAVLALLRMADIELEDFTAASGYEPLKAKLEGVSISLTDQIMEFWKQNEDLEVEVDIKPDSTDEVPYNNGPNLYLRIKNRRHRGVSTPFQQRSRGFIWFFSFLVWFDSVKHQLGRDTEADGSLILLLDEPGLALHALAQSDFLRYIDVLSQRHQVLYTTHSPFMINSDRLHQVRVVEDRDKIGTVITGNLNDSGPRTIFPLQAALGWTIAQNLFISQCNLLVEGPSELIYLKMISAALEHAGREGLKEEITIVPVGGLDKVATFVALLGGNGLQMAVLHDFSGAPEQRLSDLARQKLIQAKYILNASQFRDLKNIGSNGLSSDIEDLFDPKFYLDHFSKTFEKQLADKIPTEADLPAGDRIVERLERWLKSNSIETRPSGGFNHYAVAAHLSSHAPKTFPAETLKRFEALFKVINGLFQ